MTERLYYEDATIREFRARVIDLGDEGRRAWLDRTAFYPTSGGQPHDAGQLGGIEVTDVVDEDDRIAHVLAEPLPAGIGDEVRGEIDWVRRLDHMQQHTGQHLLSAVLADALGARTVSVHFGAESSTLDIELESGAGDGLLSSEVLAGVEASANDIVAEARPVTVSFEDADRVEGLRKASDRGGMLRIVSIADLDRSACGGTHVSSTSQVGAIMIRGQERIRSAVRVEFLCGQRTLRRAHRDLDQLSRIARQYSASVDDVAGLVESQAQRHRELEQSHRRLQEHLAVARADALYHAATPNERGTRVVHDRRDAGGADGLRAVALAIVRHPNVVFIGSAEEPATVMLAASEDSGVDASATLRPLLQAAGGRGGGSARLAQGSVPTREALERVLGELTRASSATAVREATS